MTQKTDTFFARLAHHMAEGKSELDAYRAMLADPEVPHHFSPQEASEITGLTVMALRQRRVRGQAPAFIERAGKSISYTKPSLLAVLIDGYRAPAERHGEDA